MRTDRWMDAGGKWIIQMVLTWAYSVILTDLILHFPNKSHVNNIVDAPLIDRKIPTLWGLFCFIFINRWFCSIEAFWDLAHNWFCCFFDASFIFSFTVVLIHLLFFIFSTHSFMYRHPLSRSFIHTSFCCCCSRRLAAPCLSPPSLSVEEEDDVRSAWSSRYLAFGCTWPCPCCFSLFSLFFFCLLTDADQTGACPR